VEESYESLARMAGAALGISSCDVGLVGGEPQEIIVLRPRSSLEERFIPRFRFPLSASPASAQVVESGETWLSNEPEGDPLYDPSLAESDLRSALIVPLRHEGHTLGLFYGMNKPGGFRHVDRVTLEAMARAAGFGIAQVLSQASERKRRLLSDGLVAISRAFLRKPPDEAPLGLILDQLWRVLSYRAAAALILEGDLLRIGASRGGSDGGEGQIERASNVGLSEALEGRKVRELPDPRPMLEALGFPPDSPRLLVAPHHGRQELLGALIAVFDEPADGDAKETQTLAAFAEHVAAFLDVAAQQRRERQARARTSTMGRFTRLAATRLEPKALLEAAAEEILPLSGAEQVVFYSAHARNAVLIPMAHKGLQGADPTRLTLRVDLTAEPLAPLIQDRSPIVFQAAEKPIPEELAAFTGARSVLLLPLVVRDVLIGAAVVASISREQSFDTTLVEFLHDVVQPIALGMENARLFASLAQTAGTDELSQLANRRKFMETLAAEESRARRNRTPLSLLIVDVDLLKKVNDTYGHPAGDKVIRHVADTLTRRRRITDLPARMGGEEFALLLPGTGKEPATMTAERVCREVGDKPVPEVGKVTVSIGLAALDEVGDGEELIRLADQRLYAAKGAGRNQVCSAMPDELVSLVPEG